MANLTVRARKQLLDSIRAINATLGDVAEELLSGKVLTDSKRASLRKKFDSEFRKLNFSSRLIIERILPIIYVESSKRATTRIKRTLAAAEREERATPPPSPSRSNAPFAVAILAGLSVRDRAALARVQAATASDLVNVQTALTRAVDSIVFGVGSVEERISRVKEFFDTATGSTLVKVGNRNYSSEYYSKMVVTGRLAITDREATRNTYLYAGVELAMVSENGSDHPECAQYEGEVFSLTGDEVEIDGVTYPPIESATGPGELFHPNCQHTLIPWSP